MRRKQGIISVLLISCMIIGSMTVSSFAADKGTYIKLLSTQSYADAQTILRDVNRERKKRGLSKLKLDKKLTRAAMTRAVELSVYVPTTSPHKRPNGKLTRSINKKIIYECCAEGGDYAASEVVRGWMNSPPHKKGILLKNAKSIGIGAVTVNGYDYCYTLEFSSSKAKKSYKANNVVSASTKVYSKSKYIKKKYFSLSAPGECYRYDENFEKIRTIDPGTITGDSLEFALCFNGRYAFNRYGAVVDPRELTWSSSDPAVASVDGNGVVTTKTPGRVTITAKMNKKPGYVFTENLTVEDRSKYESNSSLDNEY